MQLFEGGCYEVSDCIECRQCETNCPFGVEVVEKMRKASEIFGY